MPKRRPLRVSRQGKVCKTNNLPEHAVIGTLRELFGFYSNRLA